MRRVHLIYEHPVYQEKYRALQAAEKDRRFCKHTLEHFIDVARLMYIYALEQGLSVSKEVIYAMAFMHDIGRIDQLERGIPHEQAGAELCDIILPECGFTEKETETIKAAILRHRNAVGCGSDAEHGNAVDKILYWADKRSRNCYACDMQEECNWDREKMNLEIDV